jgi:hypothetical protein
MTTNRLATIATRQRRSRTRDLVFAGFVALATIIAATSIATAAEASAPLVSIER